MTTGRINQVAAMRRDHRRLTRPSPTRTRRIARGPYGPPCFLSHDRVPTQTTERIDDDGRKRTESTRTLPFAFRAPVAGSELQDSRMLNIFILVQREAPDV